MVKVWYSNNLKSVKFLFCDNEFANKEFDVFPTTYVDGEVKFNMDGKVNAILVDNKYVPVFEVVYPKRDFEYRTWAVYALVEGAKPDFRFSDTELVIADYAKK